ncbi:MAG: C39 family peptidase [Lachnospiraceae bacterium]|nr:C39 family peptidase [Lachnospiraceae bacterium]
MRKRAGAENGIIAVLIILVLITTIFFVVKVGDRIWLSWKDSTGQGDVLIITEKKQEEETLKVIEKTDIIDAFAKENGLQRTAWPKELIELLENNPDTEEFVLYYPVKKDQNFEIDLSEYKDTDSVPLFLQWDERWGYTIYGSNVMGLTGCGPTCLSMVLVHLLQDATYTPRYVADFAEDNNYYAKGSGSKWALISEGGETLGLDVTELPLDENRMKKNLELGNPIICIMGPGDFTVAGHFIVLRGLEDGKFIVNDPNSRKNSERLWSYEEISGQIKNLWACRVPE